MRDGRIGYSSPSIEMPDGFSHADELGGRRCSEASSACLIFTRVLLFACFQLALSDASADSNQTGSAGLASRYSVQHAAIASTTQTEVSSAASSSQEEWPSFNRDAASVGLSGASVDQNAPSAISGNTVTVVSSLVLVLGLFAAFVWITRKFNGNREGSQAIPEAVLKTIGVTTIDHRMQIRLLQMGSRILVVAQSSQATNTLCEIRDPDECRAIIAACHGDSKNEFIQTLREFESRPAESGFTGDGGNPRAPDLNQAQSDNTKRAASTVRGRLFGYA